MITINAHLHLAQNFFSPPGEEAQVGLIVSYHIIGMYIHTHTHTLEFIVALLAQRTADKEKHTHERSLPQLD